MCSEQMKKLSVMKKSDTSKNFLKVFIQKTGLQTVYTDF